jgi:cysteine-rich repeat protein
MRKLAYFLPFTTTVSLAGCPGTDPPGVGTDTDPTGTSGSTTAAECMVGSEGCACTPGGGCDPGLTCQGGTCMDAGSDVTTVAMTTDEDTTVGVTTDPDSTTTTGTDTTDTTTTTGDPPPPNCGDGQLDPLDGEQCDDGNTDDGDGCDSYCEVEVGAACGDGNLEPGAAEECDDGNTDDGDGCSANCQLELVGQTCGDAAFDPLEVCDDGNVVNGDTCNPTCNLTNTTELWLGSPGQQGLQDGQGNAARLGGWCVLAADNTYLWLGDSANMQHAVVRRVEIATADVVTIAGGPLGNMDGAVGTNARFGWIEALATDGTTVWIADEPNHVIKAMDVAPPHAVTTVAGSGANQVVDGNGLAAAFSGVRGITYYDGMLYVLDGNNAILRRLDPVSGDVTTVAGTAGQTGQLDGFGAAARFISPRYMTSDNSGTLYIADTNGNTIRTYSTFDTYVGTFAGSAMMGYADGIGPAAVIHRPRGMTSDGTSIYFSEFDQHTIRQGVIATTEVTTNVGQHCNGMMPCSGGYQEGQGTGATQLDSPVGLAFHQPSNTVFVCDAGNNVVRTLQ